MPFQDLALPAAASFLVVLIGLWPLTRLLRRRNVLDIPVDRSSHSTPTPKGAGLLIVPTVIGAWFLSVSSTSGSVDLTTMTIGAGAGALLVVSWIDDVRNLPPLLRLSLHFACAIAGCLVIPGDDFILQGIAPPMLDRAVTVLIWVWFINLFNFMDGIDGISAIETLVIGGGLAALATLAVTLPDHLALLSVILVGAMMGFLPWNWHPARIFLGDSGSAPVGFLLGWLLISLAAAGEWAIALILPAYYLTDSGLTLSRRLLRGEKIWRAHREHAYQHAAAMVGHARVSIYVAIAGLLFIAIAAGVATTKPFIALVLTAIVAAGFMFILNRLAQKR